MSDLVIEHYSQHSQNLQQITETAYESYDSLYSKYGIKPNAWVMSIDVVETLRLEINMHVGWRMEPASSIIKFMNLPIHIVYNKKGLIKAIIEEETPT